MRNFSELVLKALPEDMTPEEIIQLAPTEWRKNKTRLAWAYALRKSPRINWDAYCAENPDVEAAGLDPCLHFLEHGVHEGRRLRSWHPLKQKDAPGAPLVSVVIAIYNNSLYLRKCLESALNQTLRDIEIIAVNDASTDNSLEIIQDCASRDSRLRLVNNDVNVGIFSTRKNGVLAARGRYLMFMDGDDYLKPDGCEAGYRAIRRGYDIVQGGADVLNITRESASDVAACAMAINGGARGEYRNSEIIEAMFVKRALVWPLWSKIFLRELCVAGYSDLEDGYFVGAEDVYAMCAIARLARNLFKIDDKFYNYIYGTGISTLKHLDDSYKLWFNHGDTIKALGEYARSRHLEIGFGQLAKRLCNAAISKWAASVPAEEAARYFDLIKSQYGLECVAQTLLESYAHRLEMITPQLLNCPPPMLARGKGARLGVFIHWSLLEDAEEIFDALAQKNGLREITVFLDGGRGKKWRLPENFRAVALAVASPTARACELIQAIKTADIHTMLHVDRQSPSLLTDLVIFYHFNIPVVLLNLGDFCLPFMNARPDYPYATHELAMRWAGVVACFSTATEAYLRLRGINAWRVSRPMPRPISPHATREYDVATVITAATSEKEAKEFLNVMRVATKGAQWLRALIICRGASVGFKEWMRARIREMDIRENIRFAETDSVPCSLLANARLYVSTSRWDGQGRYLAMARAAGLPGIIYDIPNDGIGVIKIPQCDVNGMAEAVLFLLENEKLLDALTKGIANTKHRNQFGRELLEILNNFHKYSPWGVPNKSEYEKIVQYASFYYC